MAVTLLQFRTDPLTIQAEREVFQRHAAKEGITLSFLDSLDTTLSWQEPKDLLRDIDGLLLGGSGDFDFDGGRSMDDPVRHISRTLLARLTPFLQAVFTRDIPTLGICYGHQLLGAFNGATVAHDPTYAKTGTHIVTTLANQHPLSADVEAAFLAQYHHKDVLMEVPDNAAVIFLGERCKAAGIAYSDNIASVQFHPELSADDLKTRLNRRPLALPLGQSIDDVVKPSPHAPLLLSNFFRRFSKID